MSAPVRVASAFLTINEDLTREVDRVIGTAFKKRHPVYLFIPMDVPDIIDESSRLGVPLDWSIRSRSPDQEYLAMQAILEMLNSMKRSAHGSAGWPDSPLWSA
jgi:TPP-dependent 2-oxoacid decarboxylase